MGNGAMAYRPQATAPIHSAIMVPIAERIPTCRKTILALATAGALAGTALPASAQWYRDHDSPIVGGMRIRGDARPASRRPRLRRSERQRTRAASIRGTCGATATSSSHSGVPVLMRRVMAVVTRAVTGIGS